jgi:NAD(P)-dependent dehydrogenase (short-subunit alcohol dehydrogenase family)
VSSRVAGKVIAITRVNAGIGRACARSLARPSRGVTATAVAVDQGRSAGAIFSAALTDALAGKWTR